MASFRTDPPADAGYATVAALGVSLAVALLAGALVLRGVSALKLAGTDYRRTEAQYALSGVQTLAAIKLLGDAGPGRLAWSAAGVDGHAVSVLAEGEADKLDLGAASQLDDKVLARLGADDPAGARTRLAALDPASATSDEIAGADPARAWRQCAVSVISPWGLARTPRLVAPRSPNAELGGARAGQVWRIRTVSDDGWIDERVVRLIGRSDRPSAVIWRRFGHGGDGAGTCDKTI